MGSTRRTERTGITKINKVGGPLTNTTLSMYPAVKRGI
nr:MAG TPA: hypothetical protein [Caudoviricetes sp.]